MASNPLVSQGVLNRLRGSVGFPNFPVLNVTAPYLGKEGIGLALQGETTTYIQTMTGAVTSPEPFQMVQLTIALLKTQFLANQFKIQMETLSTIGPCIVKADSSALGDYSLINCSIQSVEALKFSGETADFMVTIGGYYNINSSLWGAN